MNDLRHGQWDPRDHRFDTHRDDKRTDNYRESRYVNLKIDRRIAHEVYYDTTRKVKVDVPLVMVR